MRPFRTSECYTVHNRLPDLQQCIDEWQHQFANGPEVIYKPDGEPRQVGQKIEKLIGLDLTGQLTYDQYIHTLSRDCSRFILEACGIDADEIISKTTTPAYSR